MKSYENVVIINPTVDEEGVNELVNKFTALINSDGEMTEVKKLGMKKLAYPIQKQTEGNYICFEFKANESLIAEFTRVYRITDNILKFLVVKVEE